VKKKLAALDVRIQIGVVVVGLLIFGFAGRTFLVSPQSQKAADLQKQIDDTTTQITTRRLQARSANRPDPIKVADLFRLAKAMPDREDMPGIILTISQVARGSGIKFDTIEPQEFGPAPVGSFRIRKIHLVFNGDFYALSDFLYRLRSLVTVHDGRLDANGRLFTVDTITFSLTTDAFPNISADLVVDAYVFGTGPAVGTTPAPATGTDTTSTTTTSTDTTTTPSPAPDGATAAGATP
jgi:Tfp pilus assembly protein PilO